MPSEFDDPRLAPRRARDIGRPQFLRWALLAAAAGAVTANLDAILGAIGPSADSHAFPQPGGGDRRFVLHFLAGAAAPFLVIGAGLALAATVEVRRAAQGIRSGTILAVWVTWGLLAMGALGMFFRTGTP